MISCSLIFLGKNHAALRPQGFGKTTTMQLLEAWFSGRHHPVTIVENFWLRYVSSW